MNEELVAFGEQLRAIREERDLTLQEVEAATRIRIKFLLAFEAGEIDPALSVPQIRGFLRNYARFLHLDPEETLAAYEQALLWKPKRNILGRSKATPSVALRPVQVQPQHPQPVQTPSKPMSPSAMDFVDEEPRGGSILASVLYLLAGLVFVGFVGIGTVIILRAMTQDSESDTALNPPLVENDPNILNPNAEAPVQPPTESPVPPSPLPTQGGIVVAPINAPIEGLSMFINATARSWVKVTVDDVVQYEGLLRPGTGIQYEAQESIHLSTANAGGLEVILNNQSLGPLGGQGETFERTFTKSGLATPTFPPTLTPSQTSTASQTVAALPSNTPTFTSTASATTGAAAVTPLPTLGEAITATPESQNTEASVSPIPTLANDGQIALSTPTPLSTKMLQPISPSQTAPLPTPIPTITFTPTITLTPSPFLPERVTRTPHP